MAQMAPALAEAAGSPSPNTDISSSTVQDPLRPSKIEEAIKKDNSRLHINSTSFNHNGICRSVSNSKTTTIKTVSCVMEKVHRLNKLPYTRQKVLESTVSTKPNTPNLCPPTHVENANDRDKIRSLSSQKETFVSTPTRIPPITTTTCASNSLESLSSCNVSINEPIEEMKKRHSFASTQSYSQALFNKKVGIIGCNQTRLVARARKLERRLRTLQTRQLESHVGEQLSSLSMSRRKSQSYRSECSDEKLDQQIHAKSCLVDSRNVKEESSRGKRQQIRSLSREDEQHLNKLSEDNKKQVGRVENSLETESKGSSTAPFAEGDNDVARSLVCQLELVEDVADSDATQSSSGGESCDEIDDDFSNNESGRPPDYVTQFYSDRGSIASKWAWLRSQVIDIERRIRRCEETYKSVRLRKKPVQLEKQKQDRRTVVSVANKSADDLLVDTVNILNNVKEPHKLNSIRTGVQSLQVSKSRNGNNLLPEGAHNEKRNSIIDTGNSNVHLMNDHINSCTAARTRPVQFWQKRKLFSLSQLQKTMPNVLCCCSNPLTPCVLCQRNSQKLPVLKPTQDIRERVSLLDLSFHPVLSFGAEIPLSLHFGALLKKGNFQSRIFKLSPPKVPKIPTKRKYVRSASSPAAIKKGRKDSLELSYKKQGIRVLRNRKKPVSMPNTPKTKQSTTPRLCKTEVPSRKRPAAVNAGIRLVSQLQKRARSLSLPSSNSRPSSPVSTGMSPTSLGHSFPGVVPSAKRKKPTSNAFDINNIVIPYSMASTTRVEKLQYKEILTPAWREWIITPKENTPTDVKDEDDNEEEDLSDLTFALRHMKCEEQERKRFLGMAIKKKKRATRQSSEATTPEPVSPGSFLIDGTLSAGQTSSGIPSPSSSNAPSLSSSLNLTCPSGLPVSQPVVNMLPHDNILAKFDRSGKSGKHISRRSSSLEQSEDSNDTWPVVVPWPSREFPLSEKEQEDLKNTDVPPPVRFPTSVPPSPSSSTSRTNSPILSPVGSPDSAVNANWTVKVLSPEVEENLESDTKPSRKGIVLKLAKR